MKLSNLYIVLAIAGAVAWGFYLSRPQEVTVSPAVQEIIQKRTVLVPATEESEKENVSTPGESALLEEAVTQVEPEQQAEPKPEEEKKSSQNLQIPAIHQLQVPFIVQAPFGDWNEAYKEACEEASVAMLNAYEKGIKSFDQQGMKDEIDPLLDWGLNEFDGRFDTDIEETSKFFTDYYGYDQSEVVIVPNPTIEDIKAFIAAGYPVIVPAAGQSLGNRFFRQPGPVYHMLVITGYDHDEFITNDPGTRNGQGYRYKQEVLYDAIHDWTGQYATINEGQKVLMILVR